MNTPDPTTIQSASPANGQPSHNPIAHLVAQVYETSPPALRSRLLEHLLKPLGVLALVAVANGIFAKIRFHSGWPDMQLRMEDVQLVQASDVIALVERVQQVSVESVNGLARMLTASPVMTGSAAAALLVSMLMQRSRTRRLDDDLDDEPAALS